MDRANRLPGGEPPEGQRFRSKAQEYAVSAPGERRRLKNYLVEDS